MWQRTAGPVNRHIHINFDKLLKIFPLANCFDDDVVEKYPDSAGKRATRTQAHTCSFKIKRMYI